MFLSLRLGIFWYVILGCKDGWNPYNDHCYYKSSTEMNWFEAQVSLVSLTLLFLDFYKGMKGRVHFIHIVNSFAFIHPK